MGNANTKLVVDSIRERVRLGEMSASEGNVEIIRAERVRLVTGSIPRNVRGWLNQAVKQGLLGHAKKDGFKPEAYFHPTFEYLAKGERARAEDEAKRALARFAGTPETTA